MVYNLKLVHRVLLTRKTPLVPHVAPGGSAAERHFLHVGQTPVGAVGAVGAGSTFYQPAVSHKP